VLLHAVSRLALHPHITNIQVGRAVDEASYEINIPGYERDKVKNIVQDLEKYLRLHTKHQHQNKSTKA